MSDLEAANEEWSLSNSLRLRNGELCPIAKDRPKPAVDVESDLAKRTCLVLEVGTICAYEALSDGG